MKGQCAILILATLYVKEKVLIPPFLRPAVMLMRCPDSCTPHKILCCVMVVLPPFLLSGNETETLDLDRVFVLWFDGHAHAHGHAHALALRVHHHHLQCAPQEAPVDGTPPAILHHLVCHVVAGYNLMATTSSE